MIEGKLAPILQQTIERQSLPEGQDFEVLLNMVALMALRVPSLISYSKRIGSAVARQLTRCVAATPEAWKTVSDRMRAEGIESPEVPYEEMRQFVESGKYSIDVDLGQNWLPQMMIDASGRILFHLARRRWYITVVAPDAPDLICSDNPVSLSLTPMSASSQNVGFAVPGTLLLFPLNRRVALVGSFEGNMLPSPASEKTVALINAATGRSAERFLFSSKPDFIWHDRKKRVRHAADLLALVRDRNRSS